MVTHGLKLSISRGILHTSFLRYIIQDIYHLYAVHFIPVLPPEIWLQLDLTIRARINWSQTYLRENIFTSTNPGFICENEVMLTLKVASAVAERSLQE